MQIIAKPLISSNSHKLVLLIIHSTVQLDSLKIAVVIKLSILNWLLKMPQIKPKIWHLVWRWNFHLLNNYLQTLPLNV